MKQIYLCGTAQTEGPRNKSLLLSVRRRRKLDGFRRKVAVARPTGETTLFLSIRLNKLSFFKLTQFHRKESDRYFTYCV